MRLGKRVAKVLAWGLVLILLISAGVAWFAYALVTDSDTAARLIRAQAGRFLPRSTIEMGRVNIGILKGEVTVSQIHVRQRIDGQSFLAARVPWLSVKLDPRQAIHGRFEPREVVISQPTLQPLPESRRDMELAGPDRGSLAGPGDQEPAADHGPQRHR